VEPEEDLNPFPDEQIEALLDIKRNPEVIVRMAKEIKIFRSLLRRFLKQVSDAEF
jgi:hypothetical protein